MALKNPFKLEKLRVEAFSDVERDTSIGRMEVMFNPTTYSEKHAPVYHEVQGINADGKEASYAFTPPGNLALTLILDGTGVNLFGAEHALRQLRGESVAKDVKKFKELCLNMNGAIHQPNFLNVHWGPLDFPCRLASLDISYKRFDRSGEPLHAELAVSFVSDEAAKTLVAKPNKTSPDLTHLRVVKSGDTLPLLCKEIYGSSSYYLRVAADNGLDDFRHLVPGQKLRFAPLPSGQE